MTKYISLFALLAITSLHQTGCAVEDPAYTDQSAALASHEVGSPAEPAGEVAPDESSDIGTESGTWQLIGGESCFDVCMGTCSQCGFTPLCPPTPRGRSCPTLDATCWHFTSRTPNAQEYQCM
jgi:hypothetical protein